MPTVRQPSGRIVDASIPLNGYRIDESALKARLIYDRRICGGVCYGELGLSFRLVRPSIYDSRNCPAGGAVAFVWYDQVSTTVEILKNDDVHSRVCRLVIFDSRNCCGELP